MAFRPDPDNEDDFSNLYKEYTGPPACNAIATNVENKVKTNKRSHINSDDEEEEPRDPNAVPTDFTSREAKVWEAKSKAAERNWKKRKEEEMICKICGESGHFTQGCPSTLGANCKSQDYFERVPAREKHVKELFTEKVIRKIEKDIGCKIKVEEKFIIVSGKNRLVLAKGVDAVHKVKEEGEKRGPSRSRTSRSRSPQRRSPANLRVEHSDSQKSLPSPRNPSQFQQRFGRQDKFVEHPKQRSPLNSRYGHSDSQRSLPSPHNSSHSQQMLSRLDKVVEDCVREDLLKLARDSPQAYGIDGARGSSHSKSPPRHNYTSNSNISYNNHNQSVWAYRSDGWETERRGSTMQSGRNFEYLASDRTLEEVELEYRKETIQLERIRDQEEEEEKCKHLQVVKETREDYMKKLGILRGTHAQQREEFLQLDAQRRQQRALQQITSSRYGGYKQPIYLEHGNSVDDPRYPEANIPKDANYASSRHRDLCSNFRHESRDDYGKSYDQY